MSLKLVLSTDNWRPEWWGVEKCLARIKELGGKYVELTTATGFNLLEGLGFSPYVSIDHDPYLVRDLLAAYDLQLVSIDADWPIWSHHCIEVLNKTIVWADMLGCDTIITTDSDQYPQGRTDAEWLQIIRYHFSCVLPVAERHGVRIAIEPHGRLSTKPDSLLRLVTQNNSELVGINFDTGNSFIAGEDPVAFLDRVKEHVIHMHLKDVSKELAAAMRGQETGIATSEVALGEGVNAESISKCLDIMIATGREIPVSPEAGGDVLTARSVRWLTDLLKKKGQPL
jgi:sugar phosphate isomerase/epimerase